MRSMRSNPIQSGDDRVRHCRVMRCDDLRQRFPRLDRPRFVPGRSPCLLLLGGVLKFGKACLHRVIFGLLWVG